MIVKQIDKYEFKLELTASELLIAEAYAANFNMSIQAACLVMCVHGWKAIGQLVLQFNRELRIKFEKKEMRPYGNSITPSPDRQRL